ncbi:polysaccharide deacetylase family protein [Geodermatophilus sp. DF01-2]|uniref:polysaccharide deacetylase family protein n=1 Tax=Geodermatophilus sp. DF01-2 TaxID=2559610 RepID=UPI00107378C4|nr:polysaccharide deacetylase family protein [Geodermatophilus sp. DF01_2]TFV64790.1 polysaccharide deacetylase family protein [Geodermatophilus sp. DF01_2]
MDRRTFLAAGVAGLAALAGCSADRSPGPRAGTTARTGELPAPSPAPAPPPPPTPGTPQEILARSTVPVLCFHQLREFRPDDSPYARTIITPPAVFTAQLQALRDGGYTTVPGPALIDHLQFGIPLPERPVLLTFDDGSVTHHSVALPALQQFGFVGTFFPMTVVLDKPDWLSREQVRDLDRAGMTIGSHTYDHQRLDRLPADQWDIQLAEPAAELAEVVGHPVDLLAYPNGMWSPEALDRAAAAGYRAAFQLSDPQDVQHPLLTVRRIMPPPTWDGPTLLARMASDF